MDFNSSYSFDQNALDQAVTDIRNFDAAGWPLDPDATDFSAGWLTGIKDPLLALDQSGISHQIPNEDNEVMVPPQWSSSQTWALCDWPRCQSQEVFPDDLAKSYHIINVHVPDILKQWPGRCQWPGCISKSIFKKQKALELHVNNIHTNPLLCDVPGCKHSAPFSKQGQLDRHKASIHKIGQLHRCPMKGCHRHEYGFGRKDKLKEHMRNRSHTHFHCEYDHCDLKHKRGFNNKNELQEHQISKHGALECGVGPCKSSVSAFTQYGLWYHLWVRHSYTKKTTSAIVSHLSPTNQIAYEPSQEMLETPLGFDYSTPEECFHCEKYRIKSDQTGPILPSVEDQAAQANSLFQAPDSEPHLTWNDDMASHYNMEIPSPTVGEGQESLSYL